MESRLRPATPDSAPMKRKDTGFAASPGWFRSGGLINVNIACARRSRAMTLSHPDKQQCSLTNPARLPLTTAPEKKDDFVQMTNAASLTELSEEAKRSIEKSSKAMNIRSLLSRS